MTVDSAPQKDIALTPLEKLIKIFRLDSERWEIVDFDFESGDIDIFSDAEPDKPMIETTTDDIRGYDLGTVTVRIAMKHGLRHKCPVCGEVATVHKWMSSQFCNPPISSMRTIFDISVPQLHCRACGAFRKARCPLVVPNHTYTKLMKFQVARTASSETAKATAEACGVGDWIVADVIHEITEKGKASRDLSHVDTLFVDEIQSGSGQNYVTMVADQNHTLISGVEGHDISSVHKVLEDIASCGCDPKKIVYVSADMSQAYKTGVSECFPNAKLILDHFHVVKKVSEAVDTVRKRTNRELKKNGIEPPKKVKYTVLFREKNQDDKHRKRMEEVRLLNPELAQAFDLKEEFYDIFEQADRHGARSAFFRWYNRVRGSKITEMVDVSKRMLKRLNEILRWFDHRISNGVAEGMNNVYKKIKSAAYGFRKSETLIDFCFFRKGNLRLSI